MYSVNARDYFNCSPLLFQHHKTDAAKLKGCSKRRELMTTGHIVFCQFVYYNLGVDASHTRTVQVDSPCSCTSLTA